MTNGESYFSRKEKHRMIKMSHIEMSKCKKIEIPKCQLIEKSQQYKI